MNDLSSVFQKTLAQIDAEFENRHRKIASEIDDLHYKIADLFGEKSSPNAVADIDNFVLQNGDSHILPSAVKIGDILSKTGNILFDKQLPCMLPFAQSSATAFLLDKDNDDNIQHLFLLLAFRFMLSLPANLLKFHFIDTHSFGGKMNILHRLSGKLVANAIVDDEKKLSELITELEQHVREVNRNQLVKYRTLEEYNREAGTLAVPYRFVFISHFPYGFSKELSERFYNLIQSGRANKAGIFVFYSIDKEIPAPYGFDIASYFNVSTLIYRSEESKHYIIENSIFDEQFNNTFNIQIDSQFPDDMESVIETINQKAENVKQVTVSLDSYMEEMMHTNNYWKGDTTFGFKVPIGKRPVDETVYFEFGGATSDYFAMVGGRPGYGKTVLLHNIICNASVIYSPTELNFYLIDCTNGTGFKPYEKLPHATFVSITNEREYTVSALQNLIGVMYRRAELFKEASEKIDTTIEKIEEYRQKTGNILPRLVVIIDEFQVLLENEDKISRKARLYLEKIIKEGRKYGLHIIFCTQSYRQLDFNTDLITLRIAFNLKEYDSIKVLGGSNEAAATLTQKGAAIMNNQNGNVRANIYFQGAYTGKMLDYVKFANSKTGELSYELPQRFVFDGKINGDISNNNEFIKILSTKNAVSSQSKVYVGVPSFIRNEHIYFKIRRNPCSNLLIIGTDMEAAMSTVALASMQLLRQSSKNSQFYMVDFLNTDDDRTKYYSDLCKYFDNMEYCKQNELADLIDKIEQELTERLENENNETGNTDKGRIVLSLSYIQNAKKLKKDGWKASPITEKLVKILKDGPDVGIHTLVYSYNYKGLLEVLEQNILGEFENKIVLAEGDGEKALNEQYAGAPKDKGQGLIQTDDETATYNPDPFVFYNNFSSKFSKENDKILEHIFSIYN